MEGDGGFNLFGASDLGSSSAGNMWTQAGSSSSRSGLDGLDLNSQAAATGEEFPHLGDYGAFLQSGSEHGGAGRGCGLPPLRPAQRTLGVPLQRVGGGRVSAAGRPAGRARHDGGSFLGGSSSGAAGAFRGARGRQVRANAATRAGARGRDKGRGGRRGERAAAPQQAFGGEYFNVDDDDDDDDGIEDLGSYGGPPVSKPRATWSDQNNSILLRLCIERSRAGNYVGGQMNGTGYKAIGEGYHTETGKMFDRRQLRNQIGQLKSTHSFWRYLQSHTGLGRKPDGSIDTDSKFWKLHTQGKPWLKKLKNGQPPANLDQLEEMFAGQTVDGSSVYVPGQDFFEEDEANEGDELAWGYDASEDLIGSPTSSSSRMSTKRSLDSTTTTCDSPVKKSKSPMVKYVRQIATNFNESVQINKQVMQKCLADKVAAKKENDLFSAKRCQDLAFECGIGHGIPDVLAMGKLFKDPFQREFFCGLPSAEARLNYFKGWCSENMS